jgi:hypothetical protein
VRLEILAREVGFWREADGEIYAFVGVAANVFRLGGGKDLPDGAGLGHVARRVVHELQVAPAFGDLERAVVG